MNLEITNLLDHRDIETVTIVGFEWVRPHTKNNKACVEIQTSAGPLILARVERWHKGVCDTAEYGERRVPVDYSEIYEAEG